MLAQIPKYTENKFFEEFDPSFNCFEGSAAFPRKKLSILQE